MAKTADDTDDPKPTRGDRGAKPTILIGTSTTPQQFTKKINIQEQIYAWRRVLVERHEATQALFEGSERSERGAAAAGHRHDSHIGLELSA